METRPDELVVGLVVAMQSELDHLIDEQWIHEPELGWPYTTWTGAVDGVNCVALQSGIGMVNAGAATERLIQESSPTVILNFGCAGSHQRTLLPGDVVIGTGVAVPGSYRVMATGEDEPWVPEEESTGSIRAIGSYPTEVRLVQLASSIAASAYKPEPWPIEAGWPPGQPYRAPRVVEGVVASSDIWTQSHSRIETLVQRYASACEDMEAAAIAQIARRHGIPFLTVKDMSNNELWNESDTLNFSDFPTAEVGKRSAGLIRLLVPALGEAYPS